MAQSKKNSSSRVDFHGLTKRQALEKLELLIDRALVDDTPSLEIIHGLGTGTIKTAIHQYLAKSKHIRAFKLDDLNPGVTWVYF